MNNKAIIFIKNLSYALLSNLISLAISSIVILVVPKLLGVEEYGYWQVYLFYTSYVGFLHFGWNDGIYLRYGGMDYRDLNKKLFFSQFWALVFLQVLLGFGIVYLSSTLSDDVNRIYILKMTAFCMLIINARFMLIYILQATNRIKEFAQITLMEKIIYCCLIVLLLLVGVRHYNLLIYADLIGKLISLIFAIYCCKDIVFKKVSNFYIDIREILENINDGIKIMVANIASMLIIGIVQFGIERSWDVLTFGKISLTLSVSNLIMIFVNAIGMVLFPVLRRADVATLPKIYTTMKTFLMFPLLGILVAYYPLKIILSEWLPQYAESLTYMALLFPICVYEGKMAFLINTYLKTLRKEKMILTINLASVILSIIFTILFTLVFKNLLLTIVSIVVLLGFRSILAEVFLSRILRVSVHKDILLEITMTFIFILIGWFVTSWFGVVYYLVTYGLYLLIKKRDIIDSFKDVKQLVKGSL